MRGKRPVRELAPAAIRVGSRANRKLCIETSLTAGQKSSSRKSNLTEPEFGDIATGVFTPVLAKHSKSFNLIDTLAVGVDRIQQNFEPMQRQVEHWGGSQISEQICSSGSPFSDHASGGVEIPRQAGYWLLLDLGQGIQKLASTHDFGVSPTGGKMFQVPSHKKVGLRSVRALKKHIVIRIGTRPNPLRRLNPQASFPNRTKCIGNLLFTPPESRASNNFFVF